MPNKENKILSDAETYIREAAKIEHKAEYKQLCQGFGTLLQNAGPLHSIGFLISKPSSEAHKLLLEHLAKHLNIKNNYGTKLIEMLTSANNNEYRYKTKQLARAILWHKRLSKGMIQDD